MSRRRRNTDHFFRGEPIPNDPEFGTHRWRRELREEFWGMADPHHEARAVVAEDPVLADRFQSYEASGGPVIDLASVPRHRRPHKVEEALQAFHDGRSKGPCGACGSFTHRWPQVVDPIYLDAESKAPAHITKSVAIDDTRQDLLLCGWCADQASWRTEGLVGLARVIFAATAGYRGTLGDYRAYFAFEKPDAVTGQPWGHVSPAAAIPRARTALANQSIARSRLIATDEQAALLAAELPGTKPYVWTDVPKPVMAVANPSGGPTKEEHKAHAARVREHQAFLERKAQRSRHDRLLVEQAESVRGFVKAHSFDPAIGMSDKDAAALDGLLALHVKAHRDNGCRGNCIQGNVPLGPSCY